MTDWAAALDEFEARLDACRALLDDDAEPDPRPWPPDDLEGALPADLVDRARLLVARAGELERELTDRQASLPGLRSTVRRRRNPGPTRVSTEL